MLARVAVPHGSVLGAAQRGRRGRHSRRRSRGGVTALTPLVPQAAMAQPLARSAALAPATALLPTPARPPCVPTQVQGKLHAPVHGRSI